jgi:hypothetical protein
MSKQRARELRTSAKQRSPAVQSKLREMAGRPVLKKRTYTKKFASLNRKAKNRRCQHLLDDLGSLNSMLDDKLELDELISYYWMQHDPKLIRLLDSNDKFRKLKHELHDGGMRTMLSHLELHPDQALLLTDEMMVSYNAWDQMRADANMQHLPYANKLKELAKTYNAILQSELGLVPVDDGTGTKGYQADLRKLHKWVTAHALANGFIKPENIPIEIIYKLSFDGSNMGSRNCDLVAITPMNLGLNPQSYHSVFPLMLYEGKESRENFKKMLGPLNASIDQLRQPHILPCSSKHHTCDFIVCADYFALIKSMVAKSGEIRPDGSTAKSCTCSFCGACRNNNTGWCKITGKINQHVWECVPDIPLDDSILNLSLAKHIFCLLHAKVRIVGSLLKHLMREAEGYGRVKQFKDAMCKIISTFNVTLKGDVVKSTGKKAKAAKVSALQGEQVDKILACVRVAYGVHQIGPCTQAQIAAGLCWKNVIASTGLAARKQTAQLEYHNTLWQLLPQ